MDYGAKQKSSSTTPDERTRQARRERSHPVTVRQSTLRLITTGMIAVLVACGDPKYQAPAITVTFSTSFPPPTALDTSATAGIAAVVANDPQIAGVNFTCLPASQCGTFTPSTIASNVPTSYQAPPTVPPGSTVTVTATSVTDSTKSVSATITID